MKKITTILFFFLISYFLHAQKEANNWYFGYNAGITFSTNPPTTISGGMLYTIEGCASISDNNGILLIGNS